MKTKNEINTFEYDKCDNCENRYEGVRYECEFLCISRWSKWDLCHGCFKDLSSKDKIKRFKQWTETT